MYNHAKGFPGLVHIEKEPFFIKEKGIYKVVMKTRGIPCMLNLKNENDWEMVKCVLTGLVRLHNGNFVHRDIRLPNIVVHC
jgi:serine/threonine protein kinase